MSDQRLALDVLRKQDLVPEHIETRNLYTPMHPGISQGQLHMWIDMFKKSDGVPPPPVDVSPWKPEKYVLRVVVWNTKDVILNERSLIAGDSMSDIYVKGWVGHNNNIIIISMGYCLHIILILVVKLIQKCTKTMYFLG